jgi:hypothetical protein
MNAQTVQDKRDGLDLAILFKSDDPKTAVIIRTFEQQLGAYLLELLNPGLSDADALWVRAKAIGMVEVLTEMGRKIATVEDMPVKQAARSTVRQSLGY